MLFTTTTSESETEESLSAASLQTTLTNSGQTIALGESLEGFHEPVDNSEDSRTQWSSPIYAATPSPVPVTVAQIHGASNRQTVDHKVSEAAPDGVGIRAGQTAAPGHRPQVQPAVRLQEAVSAAFRPPDPMKLLSQLATQFQMQQEQQAMERRFQQER